MRVTGTMPWVALVVSGAVGTLWAAKPPVAYPVEAAPEELEAPVKQGLAALGDLQKRLGGRLKDALSKGPPQDAITVCKDEAPALTAEVGKGATVKLGRTSMKLRNPANAPPPWAKDLMARQEGKPAAEVPTLVFDLGGSVGVLKPLAVGGECLACHGPAQSLTPEVHKALKAAYPKDKAVGFAAGDLRGFAWAEVQKSL